MTSLPSNIDFGSLPVADGKEPVVWLSIQNPNDRKLFKQFLPDFFTVEYSEEISKKDFDLCILDEQAFEIHEHELQTLKQEKAPVFLPVLLLSQSQDKIRKNPDLLEFADDVVYIPVSKKLLQSRINILLKQREYSLKLEEKNRELEEKNRELAEEKRKYQLITENSTDMISRHTPDGTYLYASPASEELTGYTPDELLGQNAFANMHPEDQEVLMGEDNVFLEKSTVRWTFRKKTKNGEYKWVESTLKPINDGQTGKIIEIQASTRDISARKNYERKLEEEKKFIDKTIQSIPELFFVIDEDMNFVRWNNIERELGYSDEKIPNMHPLEFFPEKDRSFVATKVEEAFKTGNAEAELQMRAKDGDIIPYFISANAFTKDDREFIVGSCINLSEIKEAQFELEKQRQLLNAIINQTKSLIYLKDEEGRYRLVNDSYLDFYNLERDSIIGKTDREVHGDEFANRVGKTDYQVLQNRESSSFEETRTGNGKDRLFHTIKYPLSGVPDFESSMCGISTDITDLKKASKQLQERIKEQRCLYKISSLSDEINTIEGLLEKAVTVVPSGWQYPDITEAAVTFGDKTYQTEHFQESRWNLTSESEPVDGKILQLKVIYSEESENADEDPFLEEEQQLIESIMDLLSSQIERIISAEKLKESQQRWENLVKNDPDLIQILEPDGTIQFINQAGANILGFDDPQNVIGKNYFDLVELEDEKFSRVKKRVQHVLEGNEIEPHIYKIRNSKDDLLYIESQAVHINLDDGRTGLQQVAKDVTSRILYDKELEQSLKEKKTLLQEIHHRVKNNLAVVSGMMELQSFKTKNKEVHNVLADSKNRIKTMALIHEKLYQSESLSQIDFASYVADLIKNIKSISASSDDVDIRFDYDSFNLNVNQAVPCALIINEVVANAFEHAFTDRDQGVIRILMRENDNMITITVEDNGKGLPENFASEEQDSMGLTIISTLIRQLNADHELESEDGLAFTFKFEKQEIKGSSSAFV